MDIRKNIMEIKKLTEGIELAVRRFEVKIKNNEKNKQNSQEPIIKEREIKYIHEATKRIIKKCLERRELITRGRLTAQFLKPINEIISVCENIQQSLPLYLSWMQIYHDNEFFPVLRNLDQLKYWVEQLKV